MSRIPAVVRCCHRLAGECARPCRTNLYSVRPHGLKPWAITVTSWLPASTAREEVKSRGGGLQGLYTVTLTAAIACFRAKQAPHIVHVFEVEPPTEGLLRIYRSTRL